MSEPHHVWFLVGIKPGENTLTVFAMNWSEQGPEFATEHEPRALAAMKKRVPDLIEGFRLHACRMTPRDDHNLNYKDAERWHREFRRFLARCELTLIEQKEILDAFRETLVNRFTEIEETGAGLKPITESLWGKTGKIKVTK